MCLEFPSSKMQFKVIAGILLLSVAQTMAKSCMSLLLIHFCVKAKLIILFADNAGKEDSVS